MPTIDYAPIKPSFNWNPQTQDIEGDADGVIDDIHGKMSQVNFDVVKKESERVNLSYHVNINKTRHNNHFVSFFNQEGDVVIKYKPYSWWPKSWAWSTAKSDKLQALFRTSEKAGDLKEKMRPTTSHSASVYGAIPTSPVMHPPHKNTSHSASVDGVAKAASLSSSDEGTHGIAKHTLHFSKAIDEENELENEDVEKLFTFENAPVTARPPNYGAFSMDDVRALGGVDGFFNANNFDWNDAIVLEHRGNGDIGIKVMPKDKYLTNYCKSRISSENSSSIEVSRNLRRQSVATILGMLNAGGVDKESAMATFKATVQQRGNKNRANGHLHQGGMDQEYLQVGLVKELFTLIRQNCTKK